MKYAITVLLVLFAGLSFVSASPLKHLKVRINGKNTTIGECSYKRLQTLNSLLHSKTTNLLDPHVFTLKIGNTSKTLAAYVPPAVHAQVRSTEAELLSC